MSGAPKLNVSKTVEKLHALRRTHGADSPVGNHCTNLDEIYQDKANTTDPDVLKNLTKSEARQWAGLGRALRARCYPPDTH